MGPNLLYKFILSVMFVVSMRRELNFLNRMLQLKLENNDLLLFITMFCSLEGKVRMKKFYFCTCSFPEIKNLNKNSIFYLLSSRRQSSNDFFISLSVFVSLSHPLYFHIFISNYLRARGQQIFRAMFSEKWFISYLNKNKTCR